jgi:Multiubiquitin
MPNEDRGHDTVTIIVNARTHPWNDNKISFEQVVLLAYPAQPVTDQNEVTVRYSRGQAGHGSGTLTSGRDVTVKEGMVFDVYRTSRS